MAKKKKCYVVYVGAEVGVFNDWETVKPLVDRYPDATHKGFNALITFCLPLISIWQISFPINR